MEQSSYEDEEVQLSASSIKRITNKLLEQLDIRLNQAIKIRLVLANEGEAAAQQELQEVIRENGLGEKKKA
ncbi:hypothetical protein ACFL3T_00220 [Patescibacteria group bacterium]